MFFDFSKPFQHQAISAKSEELNHFLSTRKSGLLFFSEWINHFNRKRRCVHLIHCSPDNEQNIVIALGWVSRSLVWASQGPGRSFTLHCKPLSLQGKPLHLHPVATMAPRRTSLSTGWASIAPVSVSLPTVQVSLNGSGVSLHVSKVSFIGFKWRFHVFRVGLQGPQGEASCLQGEPPMASGGTSHKKSNETLSSIEWICPHQRDRSPILKDWQYIWTRPLPPSLLLPVHWFGEIWKSAQCYRKCWTLTLGILYFS